MNNLSLILISVLLSTIGQLLLKKGMLIIGFLEINLYSFVVVFYEIFRNIYILAGLFIYMVSILVWLLVLSRVDVSYAYPFASIGYVLTAIWAYYILGEGISLGKIIGICVICLGTMLIYKS